MGILEDVGDGEIRDEIGVHECREGEADEEKLGQRRRHRHPHQAAIAGGGAEKRHGELEDGDGERQDQGEMADLDDHCPVPCPSFQTPFSFSLSARSFGM